MSGWVYLIRNGADLYKIGITQNLEQRMKQLKPDEIVSTLETEDYEQLEKKLHKRYKSVRVPQSEYFRLTDSQLSDCKNELKEVNFSLPQFEFAEVPKSITTALFSVIGWTTLTTVIGLFVGETNSFLETMIVGLFFGNCICVLAAFGYMFFDRDEELSLLENISTGLVLLPIASFLIWSSWWLGHWMGMAGFEG